MSAEADDLSRALERLLVAQRSGIVTQWVLGSWGALGYGIKVQLRDGRSFQARAETISGVVDELIDQLARTLEGSS